VRRSLLVYSFLAIVVVSLASVGLAGLIARTEASAAFANYLQTLPTPMGGGMGAGRRLMMGGAEQTFIQSVDKGILIGAIIAVALAALVALAIAYYLTRPLKRLTAAARTVADGDLSHRVEPAGPIEVRQLGDAFNDMAASLSESEELRRRLVADVAHELRTPLTSLRAQAEGIAEGVLPADPARLASLVDDTRQLSRLVDDLQRSPVPRRRVRMPVQAQRWMSSANAMALCRSWAMRVVLPRCCAICSTTRCDTPMRAV
jgi:signal transduction histidine kinase